MAPTRIGLTVLGRGATLVLLAVLAACGGSSDDGAGSATTATTATTDDDAPETTTADVDPANSSNSSDAAPVGDVAADKPVVQIPAQTPSELVVTDLVEGSGQAAAAGDVVEVDYVGVLTADGTEFDNSYDRGAPLKLTVGNAEVIAGFDQALVGVKAGGRRQMDIPAELAYGESGAGGGAIPPGAAITFVIDIRSVSTPAPPTIPEMADPSECPATDGSEQQQREFDEYPPFCIDVTKTYTAEIVTTKGAFTVELYPDRAPLTVNNFVTLARYHYFDDTECHRIIPDFFAQCGDPTATGSGGPGYRFTDELPPPVVYEVGSLAMANAGPDSNGSQFFVVTGEQGVSVLTPQYTLFGEVIEGMDSTIADVDSVGNPDDNGIPPLEQVMIESVAITES